MIIIPPTNATVAVNVTLDASDLKLIQRAITFVSPPTNVNRKADSDALLLQFNQLLTQNGLIALAL